MKLIVPLILVIYALLIIISIILIKKTKYASYILGVLITPLLVTVSIAVFVYNKYRYWIDKSIFKMIAMIVSIIVLLVTILIHITGPVISMIRDKKILWNITCLLIPGFGFARFIHLSLT